MSRGRPITNKSNYWSEHHMNMLYKLAKQVRSMFASRIDVEVDELVSEGWFRQARYYPSVVGKAKGIQREMFNWVLRELKQRARLEFGMENRQ